MKAEHINPFIISVCKIMKDICMLDLKMGKPFVKDDKYEGDSSLIKLGIIGALKGEVVLSLHYETALAVISKMMMMPVNEIDAIGQSAISELGNMIAGNAATVFANDSTIIDITTPDYCVGKDYAGASCMKASLDAGKVITLPDVNTIADGTAVKTPGDIVFPYIQKNIDEIIAVEDQELIVNFLDMMENHKMLVENSGLLTVAALKHLDCKGKKIVSILSGGNMDVITLSSVVQHGLIERGRVFTVSVQLPDRPGELVNVASVIAKLKGNVIRLEHNQFVSINRNAAVELRITLEAFGHEHKKEIIEALKKHGYDPKEESPTGLYE